VLSIVAKFATVPAVAEDLDPERIAGD